MEKRRAIVWFRQDLRVHDNEALTEALSHAHEIIPVFVFDERVFRGKTRWFGFPKTGKYRAKFIIESVHDLRRSLRELGSELIVRVGKPEEILFDLAHKAKSSWIFCNRERTQEEVFVQDTLEKKLWSIGQEMRYSRGKMLYYTSDLPFPITHTPDAFTQFRKEVERYVPVRKPLPVPGSFNRLTVAIDAGDIPELEDFGHRDFTADPRTAFPFQGGEAEALRRLQYYLWETALVKDFKDTRKGLLGPDYSTKFSAWLAQGCLSPKKVYWELKKFEEAHGGNDSTYWVFYELLWRDFFRFMAKKHEASVFFKGGIEDDADPHWTNDRELFRRWAEGGTGVPFVVANMREINQTGYMSNRGRRAVAGFLVNDLQVNWQMGAEYFESLLIDYDVASNWGNWQQVAGVGPDSKSGRGANIRSQAMRYDPDGAFVKQWIPELADVPADKIHEPEQLTRDEQRLHHVRIGDDYPRAITAEDGA